MIIAPFSPPDPTQAQTLPLLTSAFNLQPSQWSPVSCSLNVLTVPPAPPPMEPEAPPQIRYPYTVWKSAVLGGVLGGIFLAEVVVLAVGVGKVWEGVEDCGWGGRTSGNGCGEAVDG